MGYWGFVFTDLIKELHLGLDFSLFPIAQMADPALLSVGSRSWRLCSLWDARQEVKPPTHCGLTLPGNTVPGCRLPIWRGSVTCADIIAGGMIVFLCPACFLSLLWSPCKICRVPVSCLSSAYAMNSGFPLQAL